jgi:hypothetical protein
MRRRTWTSVGIGATVTVAATALLTGLAGGPLGPVPAPPASANELEAFGDCEELRRWYVDAALPHVGPWGLGGGLWAQPVPLATAERAVSATGTNVQVADVDEPDLAKTDGTLVAHVEGRRLVLTDVDGADARELAGLRLPRHLGGAELLLAGDRLVVIGSVTGGWDAPSPPGQARSLPSPGPGPGGPGSTRALVVDAGDPSSPRIEHDVTFEAGLVSARAYDGVVRIVVSTPTPAIDFVQPQRGRSRAEARRENRRLVEDSSIDVWLPHAESGGSSARLVDCADVRRPRARSGYGTVTVVSFDPAEAADRRTTAVTTGSDLVYSSADRLYVATHERRGTGVHAFAVDGLDTEYVASGAVPGYVRDRWSFSEYDGHLRVATALGRNPWEPEENAVVVLEERGSDLVEVGRVARMGIGEQIRSVRWFDDLAVVVTFRQIDPLYTVDLSDPTAPRVVGELKIPGFSSYLHPLGGDLVLGLGQDADLQGRVRGAQAAVFDLEDLTGPRRVATAGFGRHTQFVASSDPRAVTYLPETRTVVTTLSDWKRGRTLLLVLTVDEDGRITRRSTRTVGGWDGSRVRTLPLGEGRVALVAGDGVELLRP